MNYKVYVLIKDKQPVYIGCTSNLENRLKAHSRIKVFDSYIVIKTFDNKEDALICENGIIRFVSAFKGEKICNGLYMDLVYRKEILDADYDYSKQ